MRHKKIIYIVAFIFSAGLIFLSTSCNDEEFLEPGLGSTTFSQPRNTIDLELLVEGSYYAMSGSGGWQGVINPTILMPSFTSDEGWLPVDYIPIRDDARQWWNRDFSDRNNSQMTRLWNAGYGAISNTNDVIDFVDSDQDGTIDNKFNDRNADAWTPRILGEAYFLRAYNYWLMVQMFGPPPTANPDAPSVILRTAPPASGFDNPPPASVQEVYDVIVSDLEKALTLLPEFFDSERDPHPYADRANKWAAHFLLSRVHLMLQNWDLAGQHATAVIESGYYELQDDVIDAWDDADYNERAPEVVWQYVTYNSNQQRWKPPIMNRYFGYTDGNGNPEQYNNGQQLSLAQTLVQELNWDNLDVAMTDERHNVLYVRHNGDDPRPTFETLDELRIWPNKWYRAEYSGWGTAHNASVPLMRLPELYLTRALIRLSNGDSQGAADDLNVVKRRVWAGEENGFTPVTASEITEDMIHLERMIEFAFEGDRIYYLQALQMDIPPGDRVGVGPFPYGEIEVPIPQNEADVNPNID